MGQYYKAYVSYPDGTSKVYSPHSAVYMAYNELVEMPKDVPYGDFNDPYSFMGCMSGLKLTEHSWANNDFMNGVMDVISESPASVAWVGDYADEESDFDGRYTREVYSTVWGDMVRECPFYAIPSNHEDGVLVNHTKGEFLDIAKHIENGTEDGWCVHPLSLLTAIGNGRGGGDYYRTKRDFDKVGTWAMDTIEYRQTKPNGYREIELRFETGM